jgi:hypothetical protein
VLREAASKRQAQAATSASKPSDSAAERKRREARAHAKWSVEPTIDTVGSFERTIDTLDQYRLYWAFGVLACLASGGFLAPFWIGLWWIIGVCAIGAVFWIIDRRSRRAPAAIATATPVRPPNEPVPKAASTHIAPQPTGSRYLPLTIAAAALAGSVICGMLQSALFTMALATVFMVVRALLLAASVTLAAWLHQRNFRLAAWVFGIVAAGYLVGNKIYVETVYPNLRPLQSLQVLGYPAYYIMIGIIFMTIPVLPVLALAVWRFRALP